jgi:GH15 family glucan-1,4-alpha-glucosidase
MALAAAGAPPLFDRHVGFVVERLLTDGEAMRPFTTPLGEPVPPTSDLPLPGYPGGRPVSGNSATGQRQLDVVGEALQLLAAAASLDRLGSDGRRAARVAVEAIERHWQEPESGLWELEPRWWTQSRLTCVAALRALAAAEPAADSGRHLVLADAILAETSRRCLSPGGWWLRSPDLPGTDASLVMTPVRGALPADDPRTVATIAEVHRSLVQEGYVYRFRPDGRPLGQREGAFLLCGFQLALAEHQQGNTVQAFRLFERNRAAAGAPGLFTEEFDVVQRQLRGNLPQAFVHAALLETAVTLAR